MKSGSSYAIITARGGSKGLPGKNLMLLAGKPLISYSILAALECPAIGRCIVSTEDPEIKEVSLQWGAEVIDRPAELATDTALSQDVVRQVLETLQQENDFPEYFVLLQPTSPLRTAKHLQDCIEEYFKSGAVCGVSVIEAIHHPYKAFFADNGGLRPLYDIESLDKPRQLLPKIYQQNGAIYIMSSKLFLKENAFFVQHAMPFVMSQEESVDIDSYLDIKLAELILKGYGKNGLNSKDKKLKMTDKEGILNEAEAFDKQINERIEHGHIPDLRRVQTCEWFYNNPWRVPEYAKLDFGEQFQLIHDEIRRYSSNDGTVKVLEVGCGPGYLCLELARAGYDVTGIDISKACVQVATQFADTDPWKDTRGLLGYIQGDFFTNPELKPKYFDAVVFLGSLHHFRDQQGVMKRVSELLNKDGLILAHEPTRDRLNLGNAAFVHLAKLLLSLNGGFYQKLKVPPDMATYKAEVNKLFCDLMYEDENGVKVQSTNDNEAGHQAMYAGLKDTFDEIVYQERYAFFHELIGGLRFDESTNIALARYLRDADRYLCELGILQSTEFFFVGQKRE